MAALSIGEKFEDAFHKIQDLTGATGLKLYSLGKSFNDVFSSTPGANFTNTAEAIGLVSQRTGLAGQGLDTLSSKFLELAKITGTDVSDDITSATSLFNQFGVTAANQAGQLDVLYKAARDAGVGFAQFSADMKATAPTAQTLGLNIDQTAAIVSNLDKLGLPASKTMLALGTAFSKAAKAGKDPTSVIADMISQIQKAPTATAATTEAIVKFGLSARSAATFVDSVRNGTFKFGATLADITNGKGGITETAFATLSLGDRFTLLKNKALVALEPIALKATDLAKVFLDKLPAAFAVVSQAWDALVGGFQNPDATIGPGVSKLQAVFLTVGAVIGRAFAIAKAAIGDVISFISTHTELVKQLGVVAAGVGAAFLTWKIGEGIIGGISKIGSAVQGFAGKLGILKKVALEQERDSAGQFLPAEFETVLNPIGLVIAGIVALGAAFYLAYEKIKPFHDWVDKVAGVLKKDFLAGLSQVGAVIRTDVVPWLERIPGDVAKLWDSFSRSAQVKNILKDLSGLWKDLQPVISWAEQHWKLLAIAMATVAAPVVVLVGGLVLLYAKFKVVRDIVADVATVLGTVLGAAFRIVGDVLGDAIKVVDGFVKILTGLFTLNFSKVASGLSEIGGAVLNALGSILSNVGGLLLKALEIGFKFVVTKGPGIAEGLLRFFGGLLGKILGGLGDLGKGLVVWMAKSFASLVASLPGAFGEVAGFFVGLPIRLTQLLAQAGAWLIVTGVKLIAGLVVGLVQSIPTVFTFLTKTLPTDLATWLVHAVEWLVPHGIKLIEGLGLGILAAIPKLLTFFTVTLPADFATWLKDAGTWLFSMGKDVLTGLYNGIKDALGGIGNIIGKIKDGFVNGLKSAFGIGSPSKLTYQHGEWIAQGLANGISDNAHLVTAALNGLPGIKAGATGRLQLDVTGLPHGLNGPAGAGNLTDKLDKTNQVLEEMLGVVKQSAAPDPYAGAGSASAPFPTGTATLGQTNPRGLRSRQRQIAATRPR